MGDLAVRRCVYLLSTDGGIRTHNPFWATRFELVLYAKFQSRRHVLLTLREQPEGFEPPTSALEAQHSTTELRSRWMSYSAWPACNLSSWQGADNGIRTRNLDVGDITFYH